MLGGYWLNAGNVMHGPFAKLVWQEAEVDSFSEGAGTSTALRYGEQTRKSLIGSLGWQAQGQWGAVRPFGRVTWEHEFKDDARIVNASPVGHRRHVLDDGRARPDSNWALFNVGASMDFGAVDDTRQPRLRLCDGNGHRRQGRRRLVRHHRGRARTAVASRPLGPETNRPFRLWY